MLKFGIFKRLNSSSSATRSLVQGTTTVELYRLDRSASSHFTLTTTIPNFWFCPPRYYPCIHCYFYLINLWIIFGRLLKNSNIGSRLHITGCSCDGPPGRLCRGVLLIDLTDNDPSTTNGRLMIVRNLVVNRYSNNYINNHARCSSNPTHLT